MTTKTYYAKLDCYSNVTSAELGNEYYTSFVKFMSYLTASNVATLVAWNSGSGAASASFDQRGYWDESNQFGNASFSLWKFHTSSTRNWEWYMCAVASSGTNFSVPGRAYTNFNLPISGWGNANIWSTPFTDTTVRGILTQAAICFSGTTSFNPWNGDFGDGNANASIASGNGASRWISGSNDRALYVLPRSNDVGGVHALQKSNHLNIGGTFSTSTTQMRYHFIYDGDALLVLNDAIADSTYNTVYIGAFELRDSLSGSGICGSNYGFLMYSQYGNPSADTIVLNSNFGDINGNTTQQNGGIAVPIKDAVSGSKGGIFNIMGTFPNTTYQPNTVVSKYEEYPIYVGFNEAPFVGLVGTFNTGLLRTMRDVQVHDTTADFSRAVFGGSTTISNLKISVPWTGSSPPGTGLSRTGSNYTWTTDYR